MTTKEQIYAEIEHINENDLDEVYSILQRFTKGISVSKQLTLMEKLQQIQFDAPADFAENLDTYLYGNSHD